MKKFYIVEEYVPTGEGNEIATRGGFDGGGVFSNLNKALVALTGPTSGNYSVLYEGHFEDGKLVEDLAIQAVYFGDDAPWLVEWANKNLARRGEK